MRLFAVCAVLAAFLGQAYNKNARFAMQVLHCHIAEHWLP
jgi:hypothetical protein